MKKFEISAWGAHYFVEAENWRVADGCLFFYTGRWQLDHNLVMGFALAQTIWWKELVDE